MTMTAEQTTRIEKMEAELHEQRQIFIQGKGRGLAPGSLVSCLGPWDQLPNYSVLYRNFWFNFISEMREIRGLLLRPRRASRESLPPNPVSDTL